MTRFWTFFLDRHHFTILLTIVLTIGGFIAMLAIPKESSPEIQIPVGIVTTILPGASSEDVERLVTDKIEDRILGVENVSKVTSTSGEGVSSISVEFSASADIEASIQLLKDEVEKVQGELPEDAEDPIVTDVNFADQPIMIASISGDFSPAELTAVGIEVKDEIERLAGISEVRLSGVRDRQVQVIVRQERLRQYGLSLGDVTRALMSAGTGSPAGTIVVDDITYAVRLDAGITDTDDVRNVPIAGPNGTPIRVGDVADVVDGLSDPTSFSRVSVNGAPSQPALTLSVFKSRGGNVVDTGNAVKEKLKELESSVLAGTQTVISYDAAEYVEHDLTELSRVGFETVALVMLMLIATIGWRESIAAAISIPLSFLIAFMGIYASGNTINFISLFSLILAIGILVDTGIVVVEAIHTRFIATGDKRAAAINAIREYATPLTAGTFTTIAVFVPLFFLSGIVGKFVASIPFTVIFVLLASIFVALGLVPLFAMYIIRPSHSKTQHLQEEYNRKARAWYERFLKDLLDNPKKANRFIWSMVGLFVLAIILPATGAVKTIFFPGENSDFIYIDIEKQQGSTLEATDLAVREIEERLYGDPQIASFVSEVGAASYFGASGGSGSKTANITVNLADDHKPSSEVVAQLRERLADITSATLRVSEPAGGPPSGTPISLTFSGEDMASLTEAAEGAARILADMPGAVNVTTSTRNDAPEFVVTLDRAKAASLGVSPASVSEILRGALYSTKAASIRSGEQDIEIRTKLDLNAAYADPSQTTHATIDAVRALLIPGTRGFVPLSSIATITYEPAASVIRHEDGERIATVSSDVAAGANALQISADLQTRVREAGLPEGVALKVGGESEDVNKSFAEMGIALLAGAALMLCILVLEFNSFRHSFYLLSIIPLSLIGVLVGLMITGAPLSFPSMLGVIALAGVIINHAIILMDSIARIGREQPDHSLEEVVIEAASSRFRPIVLTTITTVVGMIPLSFASEIWGPLAFAIMFGLAWSMVLTLILIPVLYYRHPGKAVKDRYVRLS
ncbi:MAG TPA: efflux RND transporter permease subunit [Candidatus Paceibacterota bacterium]|nr:efflux RND transporter permease subunit [Candidatus Paceibacterota bacterium]